MAEHDVSIPPVFLILSAAYISDEMAAELGYIPPAFLPLGGQRLFEHQSKLATGKVYLSLPHDYQILPVDQKTIEHLDINVIRPEPDLSLRESVLFALGEINHSGPVEILFGDTLVQGRKSEHPDLVSYQNDPANHFWSYYSPENPDIPFTSGYGEGLSERRILCGHFKMSSAKLLQSSLENAESFVEALNFYERRKTFAKEPVTAWFDFGHLALYYQSKREFSVARAFNSIESDGITVRKSSAQTNKMRAESIWFRDLPYDLRPYAPRYLGQSDKNHRAGYRLEYVYQPLLSDLYVFGNLPSHVWSTILSGCFDFLDAAGKHRPSKDSPESSETFSTDFFIQMFAEKTKVRFAEFLSAADFMPDPQLLLNGTKVGPIDALLDRLLAQIRPTTPNDIRFMHGDFFFGNIFFDFKAVRVLTIDPRAMTWSGLPTYYGDYRYDIAKLCHSIVGKYDHILHSRSRLIEHSPTQWEFSSTDIPEPLQISDLLFDLVEKKYNIPKRELLSMTALLFFSMLPLHAESKTRQKHLFANALRVALLSTEAK
ncbi:MAG: hypothetical protein COB08_003230 [Rhodobacteraceae bacterium]|nr:hypothetical protein [Paracoccaceae bacterium]